MPILFLPLLISLILQQPNKVVLITIDGVRWEEVFYGTDKNFYRDKSLTERELLPNLYSLAENGMILGKNSNIEIDNNSYVSLPGYLSIMRGKRTEDCLNNKCNPIEEKTILDLFDSAAVFSSWENISKIFPNSKYVVNSGRYYRNSAWWMTGLKNNDNFYTPFTTDVKYRPDKYTIEAAMDYYESYSSRFLWIALGDTDEWAHYHSYSNYIKSLQEADRFIGLLAENHSYKTTFIITTDHGRNNNFVDHGNVSSKRTWMMFFGWRIPKMGFVKLQQVITSSSIYNFIRDYLLK